MIKKIGIRLKNKDKNLNIIRKQQRYLMVVVINMIKTIKDNNLAIMKTHLED